MLLFIVLPLIALFTRVPPAKILEYVTQAQILQALRVSFSSAFISTLLAVLLGIPLAVLLSRKKDGLFRIVDTIIDLPTVLPPAVAGIALLMAFGRNGLVGVWLADLGITIPFTGAAVIMAQLFVAGPLFVRAASIGLGCDRPGVETGCRTGWRESLADFYAGDFTLSLDFDCKWGSDDLGKSTG